LDARIRILEFLGEMGVATTNHIHSQAVRVSQGHFFHLVRAAEKSLGGFFGQAGDGMGTVYPLKDLVGAIRDGCDTGVSVHKRIEAVAMQTKQVAVAGSESELLVDLYPEKQGKGLGVVVVVSGDPVDFQVFGQFPQQGKDLPMGFGQPAHVEGIKDIAIQDQAIGGQTFLLVADAFQQALEFLDSGVIGTQVEVGDDQGVLHSWASCRVYFPDLDFHRIQG